MSRRRWLNGLVWLCLLSASCSDGRPAVPPPGGRPGTGAAGSGEDDDGLPDVGIKPGDELPSACVGETQGAVELPLDMYIMLDRSGSMQDRLVSGQTRWEAILQALASFIQDSASSGIGVGLQFFPLAAKGVPEMCSSDADCGSSGGLCTTKACAPTASGQGGFTLCLTDSDCPAASSGCVRFGLCTEDPTLACFSVGPGGCGAQGDCVSFMGECTQYASCVAGDYAAPAVPIRVLPDNTAALMSALEGELPKGGTPTPAALSGAIALAAERAQQNLNRRVIVVLATDGLPTQCFPSSVRDQEQAVTYTAQVARRGYLLAPRILTYVIGVLGSEPAAIDNLNPLAKSGGTKTAFIVDETDHVSEKFLAALASVREDSLACEYAVPEGPPDQTLDYNLVNVQFVNGDGTQNLLYVGHEDGCAKATLGWYYDVDPTDGATPTKISVCPKTCDTLRAASGATLEIRLGCTTLAPD